MKFELLPNEILIECFEYLNALDIFNSFDKLNSRFDKLIQNILLQLDFEDVRKEIFDQFCTRILLNSELKKKIKILRLSNDGTCGQIEKFLSRFSLDEFPLLRSLTLIQLTKNDLDKLKFMFKSTTSELRHVHFIDPDPTIQENLSVSRTYKRSTWEQKLYQYLLSVVETSLLTHSTLQSYSCLGLSCLFRYVPMLKYLNVRTDYRCGSWMNDYQNWDDYHAIHLTHLIVMVFKEDFKNFERLMEQTPNLKSLSIKSNRNDKIIDAPRWENLITSLLSQLTIFKFYFSSKNSSNNKLNILRDKFEKFQSNFWQEQHHWYIEYSYLPTSQIYTIPCPSFLTYTISSPIESIDLKMFDYVTNLIISEIDPKEKCKYYYPNVTSLTINERNNQSLSGKEYFQFLKMIINLSHLKHLDVADINIDELFVLLLLILKEAPKLSSMSINVHKLILLLKDDELCKYFNKQIRKVDLVEFYRLFDGDDVTEEFCKILSNVEQITCDPSEPHQLLFLLKQLPKLPRLSIVKVQFTLMEPELDLSSIENELRKVNALFSIKYDEKDVDFIDLTYYTTKLTIWIDNNN